jgi:hypothetical protein
MSEQQEVERLRLAVERLRDAQEEALEAARSALDRGMGTEEVLVDIEDILGGASEDVRDILGEG